MRQMQNGRRWRPRTQAQSLESIYLGRLFSLKATNPSFVLLLRINRR